MNWIADSKVEDFLTSHAVKFEVESAIPICELVPDWRTKNIGRPDKPVLDDMVLVYAEAMQEGCKFPYLVVVKTAQGYQLLDGTQRCFAIETLDQTAFAAYVVKTNSKRLLDIIGVGLNFLHGVRPSKEMQISQAFLLVERHGMSYREAESEVNLARDTLQKIINGREVITLCDDAGIDTAGFTNGKLEEVAKLLDSSRRIIPKLVEFTIKSDLKANEVDQIVEEIKSCETTHDKLSVIDRWAKRPEIQERRSGKSKTDKTQQLCTMLRGVDTFTKENFSDFQFGSAKMANEIESIVKRVDGRIKNILTRYRTKSK